MKQPILEDFPKAIIFDLDGTLIDSIPAHVRAYQELAISEFGVQLEQEMILQHFGKTTRDIIKALFPHCGNDIDVLVKKKQQLYRMRNFDRVKLLPGVKKILQIAKERGINCALGSSSSRINVALAIKKFALEFDIVLTGDDVERGKPFPDIFLEIALEFDIPPKDCLVIGDSIYDIIAAKKAGCLAVGVLTGTTTLEEMKLAKADAIFENLLELLSILIN